MLQTLRQFRTVLTNRSRIGRVAFQWADRCASFSTADTPGALDGVLRKVANGDLDVDSAVDAIRTLRATSGFEKLGDFAHVDHNSTERTGLPEVIFGQSKTPEQLVAIFESLLEKADDSAASRVSMATRVTQEQFDQMTLLSPDLPLSYNATARICISQPKSSEGPPQRLGHVVILCAGTTDLPVAEEAAVTVEAFGAEIDRVYDVGVAGLHRLLGNLDRITPADVVIVVAGMDGALPSVVGGLVDAPVIAVPTSIGYGAAFGGVSALLTMLNSCASGVCVMNIDNGFGAATVAAKMLRKMQKRQDSQ